MKVLKSSRIHIITGAGVVMSAALMGPVQNAVSQPGDIPPKSAAAPALNVPELQLIRVRNVRAGLMAWVLDPSRNPEPIEVGRTRQLSWRNRTARTALQPGKVLDLPQNFTLPAGIVSVSSADASNSLIIVGRAEGIEQLKTIVARLDRPLRQVEVSMRVVSIDPAELNRFGIGFSPLPATAKDAARPALQLAQGQVPANFQDRLDELVRQGKARIVNSPRITTIDKLTAHLGTIESIPATLEVGKDREALQAQLDALQASLKPRLFVSKESSISVTPTVQEDESISLILSHIETLQVTVREQQDAQAAKYVIPKFQSLPLKQWDHSPLAVQVKDAQTIAVTGLATDLSSVWPGGMVTSSNTVLFITASIIHRAEAPPPGAVKAL